MKNLWLLTALLFINFSQINAQHYQVTTYQADQGFPNPLAKAIYQDEKGFIWTGTDLGLIQFDGKHFTKHDLSDFYIKSFFRKKSGELYVIHDGGVFEIIHSGDSIVFKPQIQGSRELVPNTLMFPKGMYEDQFGGMWISEYKSITLWQEDKLKRYHFDISTKTSSFSRSYQFIEDDFGTFWVVSHKGHVFYLDREIDQFVEVKNLPNTLINVNWLLKTQKGKILLSTTNGIWELKTDPNKESIKLLQVSNLDNVSCMVEDSQGNLFLGTWFKGLYRGKYHNGTIYYEPIEDLKPKVVNYLFANELDEIWASFDEGIALLHSPYFAKLKIDAKRPYILSMAPGNNGKTYATTGESIIEISHTNQGYIGKTVFELEFDENNKLVAYHNNTIYFATDKENLYWIEDGKVNKVHLEEGSSIQGITPDKKGNIWVCFYEANYIIKLTPEKEIVKYGKEKGIHSVLVLIKEVRNGDLYLGGRGENGYIYKYDPQSDKFVNLSMPLSFPTHDFAVDDIAQEKPGKLWLATNHGLLTLTPNQIKKIETGYLNGVSLIKAVEVNYNDDLWIGTDFGLLKYTKEGLVLFDDFNGLPSKVISYRSLVVDEYNTLWAGTAAGIGFSQKKEKPLTQTPKPIFLKLEMNGSPVNLSDNAFSNNSFLEAKFVSTTFPANKIIYQYRLKGLHSDWITLTNKQEIILPRLPQGDFTFEVRALQQGEYLWSEPIAYSFHINIAWYFSWWAILLYIIVLNAVIVAIVKWNTARLTKEKAILEVLVGDRTSQLKEKTIQLEERNEKILRQKEEIEKKSQELELALSEIQEQKQKLEVLNATKDRFFSIVAHDLRGPLNSLSNFSELLINYSESMSPEEVRKMANDLQKSVKNTFNLTENLLAWARAQMDNLDSKPELLDINTIIEQNKELYLNAAKIKNIQINTLLTPGAGILSDKDQFTFIVRNLISNAVKFTMPGGNISLKTSIVNDQAEISVQDSGVGINPAILDKLFDIGKKHSTPGTMGEKGTGLGLLLCKEFVERNGGSITVISEEFKGSCFVLKYQLSPAADLQPSLKKNL
jgi:signal transduction histidine kinase/ligand-binding sensor domain-containing protein